LEIKLVMEKCCGTFEKCGVNSGTKKRDIQNSRKILKYRLSSWQKQNIKTCLSRMMCALYWGMQTSVISDTVFHKSHESYGFHFLDYRVGAYCPVSARKITRTAFVEERVAEAYLKLILIRLFRCLTGEEKCVTNRFFFCKSWSIYFQKNSVLRQSFVSRRQEMSECTGCLCKLHFGALGVLYETG
jgi:hypothetical protein